jgi:DDE family transposase
MAAGKVIVQSQVRGRRQRISLCRLPHSPGQPIRYRHVLYHSCQADPVEVIVYRRKGFQQPWFLVVPPDTESWLPTEQVVRLYRQRMQIEQCFRDWKSHPGLRGLHLWVQKPQRHLRLLMGFTLAYLLVLLLGQDPLAERLRPLFEAPDSIPIMAPARSSAPCPLPSTCSPIRSGPPPPATASPVSFLVSPAAAESPRSLPSLPESTNWGMARLTILLTQTAQNVKLATYEIFRVKKCR